MPGQDGGHSAEILRVVAEFSVKHPDLKKYEAKIVELGNQIHPHEDEPMEEFLERLYQLAKVDELKLQSEAEGYEKKLMGVIEGLKKDYEEKLMKLEDSKHQDELLKAELEKIKKIESQKSKKWWDDANLVEEFATTTQQPYIVHTQALPPTVIPPSPQPLTPPPKKRLPKVEPQKRRMIKIQCNLKGCDQKAEKGGFCKKHQGNIDSWKAS